jgi:heme/copper-type cytochrome/quinol oxidase subunit 3
MSEAVREVLDVSEMPDTALDHRSPPWWGNLMLLMIETTMFGILVGAYFYLRQNFPEWPPVQPHTKPPLIHPVPRLGPSFVNLGILAASCLSMWWADRNALRGRRRGVEIGLVITIILGVAAAAARWPEFHALQFRWDDNAYASTTWTMLGMHLMHIIVGTCENLLMLAWVLVNGLDDKHARDVHLTGIYWYWIGAVWVPLWAIVFISPRIL